MKQCQRSGISTELILYITYDASNPPDVKVCFEQVEIQRRSTDRGRDDLEKEKRLLRLARTLKETSHASFWWE